MAGTRPSARCQSADRRGVDGVGARDVSLALACLKSGAGLLALMGRELGRAAEPYAALLRADHTLATTGTNQLTLELRQPGQDRDDQAPTTQLRVTSSS